MPSLHSNGWAPCVAKFQMEPQLAKKAVSPRGDLMADSQFRPEQMGWFAEMCNGGVSRSRVVGHSE